MIIVGWFDFEGIADLNLKGRFRNGNWKKGKTVPLHWCSSIDGRLCLRRPGLAVQLVRSRREWPFAVVVLEVVAVLMSFFVDGLWSLFGVGVDARLVKTIFFYTFHSHVITVYFQSIVIVFTVYFIVLFCTYRIIVDGNVKSKYKSKQWGSIRHSVFNSSRRRKASTTTTQTDAVSTANCISHTQADTTRSNNGQSSSASNGWFQTITPFWTPIIWDIFRSCQWTFFNQGWCTGTAGHSGRCRHNSNHYAKNRSKDSGSPLTKTTCSNGPLEFTGPLIRCTKEATSKRLVFLNCLIW